MRCYGLLEMIHSHVRSRDGEIECENGFKGSAPTTVFGCPGQVLFFCMATLESLQIESDFCIMIAGTQTHCKMTGTCQFAIYI